MKYGILSYVLSAASLASASVVWDGRFEDYTTATDFDKWSWSNQVGSYQTYIYGNLNGETASTWLTLGSEYQNPASSVSKGVKVQITSDSKWNSGPMLRTELIPQSSATLSGHLYFHVSLLIPSTNQPNPDYEHQIVFWEGHQAEIKYGQLNGQTGVPNTLRFLTSGTTQWSIEPELDTWYNFAIEVGADSAGGLYYSTGGDALTKVYTGATGSGGSDFHVGQLRLVGDNMATEEIYYSGIYVEDSLTTTV